MRQKHCKFDYTTIYRHVELALMCKMFLDCCIQAEFPPTHHVFPGQLGPVLDGLLQLRVGHGAPRGTATSEIQEGNLSGLCLRGPRLKVSSATNNLCPGVIDPEERTLLSKTGFGFSDTI